MLETDIDQKTEKRKRGRPRKEYSEIIVDNSPKRPRGRPRKNIQNEEILTLINNTLELAKEEVIPLKVFKSREGEWDKKIGDTINYFDPSLSYEITGYKPINKTQGLDFDPNWFIETRKVFLQKGHYTEFMYGSKAFNDFWDIQYDRCRNGMTSHGYTITGDHYFFLNFYQLPNLKTAKAGIGRAIDFPDFYIPLYEWFHYLELCKQLRKNAALMKARGF